MYRNREQWNSQKNNWNNWNWNKRPMHYSPKKQNINKIQY